MKVVVKKSILFNLLKSSLKENRSGHSFYSDGSFLGRFEEKEEEVDFLNSEVPLRASPTSSTQLHMKNFDVSDPDFSPASKSGFLAAAASVLEHVPDGQIEFAYERLHKLLDETIENEDERNYGSLKETFLRLVLEAKKLQLESADMRDKLIQNAAMKASKGDDARELADSLVQNYPEFDADDPYDLAQIIDDAALSLAGFDLGQNKAVIQTSDRVQPNTPKIDDASLLNTKLPSDETQKASRDFGDYAFDDIAAIDGSALKKATDKEQFIMGYNDASKDTTYRTAREKRDTSGMDPDYAEGYQRGYTEFSGEAKPLGINYDRRPSPKELMKQQEAVISIDRDRWRDDELPEVLTLIPELYEIVKEIGFKLEVDRYNLMMSGDSEKQATANIRQIFNISHLESFIYWNMMKSYYNKDYALKSMNKHLSVIFDGKYVTMGTKIFKKGFATAIKKDDLDAKQAMGLLSKVFVAKILNDVANYNYEPDKNKNLEIVLRNTFATLVSYFEAGKGIDQKNAETTKIYQGNNSSNFANNVKEEYRELIIADFLDKLAEKFLVKGFYKMQSGRKLPDNEKKNEYYKYDPIEIKEKATAYANDIIDVSLKSQAEGTNVDLFGDKEKENEAILDAEDSPNIMTDEEISQKLSNTTDFQTLAPFFGFSGAPGMRQWFLKFAKRFFEMGIISSKSGDRTLIKFHAQMVEAVLETLNENLPELANLMLDEIKNVPKATKDLDEQSRLLLVNVLLTCAEQIDDAYETFMDTGDELHSTMVSGKTKDGKVQPVPFLDSLGGQLTRTVNGMFFKKVLTKIDRAWTDYVADQLQTNKQFQNYIADNISSSANIDVKAAKSVAEYFIGKKSAPIIITNKSEKVYKSELEGSPTKGVKTLLKFGIDANAYHIIKLETNDYFEDMLMTDFARILADGDVFEGQYRKMILNDYKALGKDIKAFKSVVLKSLKDVITGSEERMAMDNLSDYEVED